MLSGDLLWHDTVWHSAAADHARTGRGTAFDFDPMFAALRPMIEAADLAVCHEEVPFAAPGAAYESYPVFAAPPEIATWIGSMGWDLCTTASNHAVDQGYDGLVRTANLLERAGVGHVGPSARPPRDGVPSSTRRSRASGSRSSVAPTASTASRLPRVASGRSRCGTSGTCWRRRARPATPAPTS